MSQALHSLARTTHLIRKEIRESELSQAELARRHNANRQTIRKWHSRDSVEDRPHRPATLHTTLTPVQEVIVVELRTMLLLPTDDLLAVTREFINPAVSRAGLGRLLRRHGVSQLRDLRVEEGGEADKKKSFKDYEPGFLHMDIKYLPQMPDEQQRRYLFVAIDRATRWVFLEIYADQSDGNSIDFLGKVRRACPLKIVKLLTDDGSQSPTASPARRRTTTANGCPAASMCSTASANNWASNTASFDHTIRRRTAWSSASTGASARSSARLGSPAPPSSNLPCATT